MADTSINILSLCSGIGGLDVGVELAIGERARVVCGVEREAYCAAILAARMEEKAVASFPVWSDVRTFDGKPWRGIVDIVTGGYPCQPFSTAGKRLGENDPRHLWPHIARIVEEVEPGIVFFENVAGHLTLGFANVRRQLEGMGYRVTAGLFTAEEAGAPHKRERLFIFGLANSPSGRFAELRQSSQQQRQPDRSNQALANSRCKCDERRGIDRKFRGASPSHGFETQQQQRNGESFDDSRPTLDDTECSNQRTGDGGKQGEPAKYGRNRSADSSAVVVNTSWVSGGQRTGWQRIQQECPGMADPASYGGREHVAQQGQDWGKVDCRAGPRSEYAFPPGPGAIEQWARILQQQPEFAPAIEPGVRGVADGNASRMDRLRALGNGVLPLEAAYAFLSLFACAIAEK